MVYNVSSNISNQGAVTQLAKKPGSEDRRGIETEALTFAKAGAKRFARFAQRRKSQSREDFKAFTSRAAAAPFWSKLRRQQFIRRGYPLAQQTASVARIDDLLDAERLGSAER